MLVVLMVWAGAIALFFNRWGKIRMLLPYQPTYKQEQSFKVPGTTACASGTCNGPHSHTQVTEMVRKICKLTLLTHYKMFRVAFKHSLSML